jgi:putative flippase GtrA
MRPIFSQCWFLLPPVLRQMIRFGSVSATALAVDVTAYASLLPVVHPAALAAFLAYSLGGLWHYLMSSAFVFRHEMPNLKPLAHFKRFARYFTSTLVGLTVTTVTVAIAVDLIGLHPYVGKLIAVPMSFLTVFAMVRLLVFAKGNAASELRGPKASVIGH